MRRYLLLKNPLMKNVSGARNSGIGTFTEIVRESYQKLVTLEAQQQEINEKFVKPGEEDAISYFKRLQLNSELTYKTAREAIELLDILPNEMREIDPDEIGWIHSYLLSDPDNPFSLLEEK